MYAEYLTRRKDEISKEQARNFQNINYLKNNIMSEWSEEDIWIHVLNQINMDI